MRDDSYISAPPRPSRRAERSQGAACLVALDSDGTVLDSMVPKHEAGFGPLFAEHFRGKADREVLLEVWRFVNLRSRSRGANRYRALAQALRLLPGHPRSGRRAQAWQGLASDLELWLASEPAPSGPALERAVSRGLSRLEPVLAWSRAADEAIADLPPPPAYEGARRALPAIAAKADILVLTGAPEAAVRSEWAAAGLASYASAVDGQERGPKAAALAARRAGSYAPGRVLVVGDAMGDLEAARSADASFFPIVPGREEECWELFLAEGLSRFAAGERSPGRGLLADFLDALPVDPPWAGA